ncbi:MAG: hypothetical protein Q4G69_09390 [Planctomycetia bacterium]|nr:hypothetical protein [Planctomycetia bacterium]
MKQSRISGLLFVLIFLILPGIRAEETEKKIPAFNVPSWVDDQINAAYERFLAWKGSDQTAVFPLITDVHAARPDFSNPPDFRDTKYHILFVQRAAKKFGADFMADLGDIGFDRDLKWNPSKKEDAKGRLAAQRAIYGQFDLPVLFCMGNHDSGRANGTGFSELRLTCAEYGSMFNGMIKKRGVPLITGPHEDYGYYDLPGKKCRVFFLNTSDINEIGMSDEQIRFLAKGLQVPENTTVVLLQHICLHPVIGRWRSGFPGRMFSNQALCMKILTDFADNQKGSSGSVQWDFTQNKGAALAGSISGDSHFDAQDRVFGVNYITTQGYGTIARPNVPENAVHLDPKGKDARTSSLCVDVVAIKPAKREMMFFRIGIGGQSRDRSFKF